MKIEWRTCVKELAWEKKYFFGFVILNQRIERREMGTVGMEVEECDAD